MEKRYVWSCSYCPAVVPGDPKQSHGSFDAAMNHMRDAHGKKAATWCQLLAWGSWEWRQFIDDKPMRHGS